MGTTWKSSLPFLKAALLLLPAIAPMAHAATLSDPAVDVYNMRIGTETFAGLYKFTTNTLLVETAQAMTNFGSDTIKFYMGNNASYQSGVTLGANITNLITMARNEPSYHQVLDMPFRHFVIWEYPFSNPDAPFQDGVYTATEAANDYREMYDVTCYFLTNYNNSAKTFYLGHWEGDGYLSVNNWSTNPSPAVVSAMIQWEINRQQAVDDAKAAMTFSNVNVFYYAEANRVRDAMLNGPTNNVRMIDSVIPYVTNLDYISYSSYDAQNLSQSDLYTTLNYMENHFPTNKAASVPGPRLWIGEYGWGNLSYAAQEPLTRAYIQRLLGWNWNGQCLPFILFWEMYSNNNPNGATNFSLIDYTDTKVPSWYLHQRFINQARLLTAQFKETNGRLPTDTEFSSLTMPMLNQVLPAPVNLSIVNGAALAAGSNSVALRGTLTQGVYGDDCASVWVFWGPQDGGSVRANWAQSQLVGVNTHFNPSTFATTISNLVPNATAFFRFYATNSSGEVWAPASGQFTSPTLNPGDFGSSMKITFPGYNRGETLSNFPVLVNLSTSLPGFNYNKFASRTGGDLRFTDASGGTLIPHEVDEWNTNGTSSVWVNVPRLSGPTDAIWAYWGNPVATNPPASSSDGSVWSNHFLVWHLKESGFPFADSAEQYPALTGVAPASINGLIGHACSFDGVSDYLNAGAINLGNAFTLSAWVNLTAGSANIQTVWANKQGGYSADGFSFYVNSYQTGDGELWLETGNGTTGVAANTGAGVVPAGQWHRVTAVVDRAGGTAHLYVDGTDKTVNSAIRTDLGNQGLVNLARFTNNTLYTKGLIDEARIENGTRSANWVWASWMTVMSNSVLANYSAVAQQPPSLSLSSADSGFTLSWPSSGVGYTIYTTTSLAPPVTWNLLTNQPLLVNTQWEVTLPPDAGGARFYRLQSQ